MGIKIKVRQGTFHECVALSKQIPEFESPYELDEYEERCGGVHFVLIAKIKEKSVGFKVGYDRFNDGSFYSWMGGVLPEFRRIGIADALAEFQEKWAVKNGFNSIKLKTRDKHRDMIQFSLNRGFNILEKINKQPAEETRIWMRKVLL